MRTPEAEAGDGPCDELAAPLRWLASFSTPRIVAGAALAGFSLGVVARVWMRWISTDPEFTWVGTGAIVASFTIFATAQAIAAVCRLRPAGRRTVAASRASAALLSAGLFVAAGAIMLPTVVFGSLATWRCDRQRAVRVLFGVLAAPSAVFVIAGIADDHGWSPATFGRVFLFISIYAIVITATWPSSAPITRTRGP